MSNFIEETLLPNEQLIYYTRPHWIIFAPTVGWIVLWAVITEIAAYFNVDKFTFVGNYEITSIFNIMALIIIVVYGMTAYKQYISSEYGITNKRVLFKMGLIARDTLEILLDKIESIQVYQTVPGRIFNYGSIIISGTGGTKDIFDNIPSPLLFRQKAQIQTETHGEDQR